MATLVDAIGVLRDFGLYSTVLPFLLVTAALYALLLKYKIFGENKAINIIISSVVGLVFIGLSRAVAFVNLLIPVITVFLLLIILAVLIFTFMGVKTEDMSRAMSKAPVIIILFFVIIILAVFAQTFPEASIAIQAPELAEQLNVTGEGQDPGALLFFQTVRIIFSPQILGVIVLFLVFGIAAYFMTRGPKR